MLQGISGRYKASVGAVGSGGAPWVLRVTVSPPPGMRAARGRLPLCGAGRGVCRPPWLQGVRRLPRRAGGRAAPQPATLPALPRRAAPALPALAPPLLTAPGSSPRGSPAPPHPGPLRPAVACPPLRWPPAHNASVQVMSWGGGGPSGCRGDWEGMLGAAASSSDQYRPVQPVRDVVYLQVCVCVTPLYLYIGVYKGV